MAYRMQTEGLKETIDAIRALGDEAMFVASWSLYDGAGVMADAINKEANTIKTEPFHYAAVSGATTRLPSPEEKQMRLDSGASGIAKFKKRLGAVDTSVGYNAAGYAPVNWNHMSSNARTNYKAVSLKGHDVNASSFLKALRKASGDATIGKGAQNMKPIGVIANAINSGTSFMTKQPFIRRAVTKATPKAIAAIVSRAESMIAKIIQENIGGKSA